MALTSSSCKPMRFTDSVYRWVARLLADMERNQYRYGWSTGRVDWESGAVDTCFMYVVFDAATADQAMTVLREAGLLNEEERYNG